MIGNISFYRARGRKQYNLYKETGERKYLIQNSLPFGSFSLETIYKLIREPKQCSSDRQDMVRDITREIRESEGEERRRKKGLLLDFVVFAGTPEITQDDDGKKHGRRKANFNLSGAKYSGLITIDIDHIADTGTDICILKRDIYENKEFGISLLFVSPSGDGLKIICKSKKGFLNSETYEKEYNALAYYFNTWLKENFSDKLQVDMCGKDISRTCYLCHDPEAIYCEEEGNEFDSDRHPAPEQKKISTPKRVYSETYNNDNDLGYIIWMIEQVERRGIDIAYDREEYLPMVAAFKRIDRLYNCGLELLTRVCCLSDKYDYEQMKADFMSNKDTSRNFGEFVILCGKFGIDTSKKHYNDTLKNANFEVGGIKMNNNTMKSENASETQNKGQIKEYFFPLRDKHTKEERRELFKAMPEGLKTGYYLSDNTELLIPAKGITFVSALSGHGKTTFLQNLALKFAKDDGEGSVIFCAFEEGYLKTYCNFLSLEIGTKLKEGYKNTKVIYDYFREGKEGTNIYIDNAENNLNSYLDTGKLCICDKNKLSEAGEGKDITSKVLVDILRKELEHNGTIKAVFIDYIQKLEPEEKKGERYEELGKVCNDLQAFVEDKGVNVPIIASAQLSNTALSPKTLSATNMAGAYDISRCADMILVLANNKKKADFRGADNEKDDILKDFWGKEGKIYVRVAKSRYTIDEAEKILKIIPESGKIDNK